MPLILTQHYSRDLNRYLDREWVIYHFPSQYVALVRRVVLEAGDRRFLYQRPSHGAPKGESATYFGYGLLGEPYEDPSTAGHFFVDIIDPQPLRPVPLRDSSGVYYESGEAKPLMLRGRSIRYIDPMRYFAILAAGQAYSLAPQGRELYAADSGDFSPASAPTDAFREMSFVPPGTGYIPRDNQPPDRHESAALHERARKDHQETLELLRRSVERLGGSCFYNNNVDLYAKLGERRFLIEAKSLTNPTSAVNRMRYGMGQLMDYGVRYRAELAGAEPVLAFGAPVAPDVSWIPTILQENGIAFVSVRQGALAAGNPLGNGLPFLQPS